MFNIFFVSCILVPILRYFVKRHFSIKIDGFLNAVLVIILAEFL